MTPSTVRVIAVVVGLAYGAALSIGGVQLTSLAQKIVGYFPTVAVVLAVVFDKWAWKWPGLTLVVGRPRLEGTWTVSLKPDERSHIPEGGNRGPIPGYICIEQTGFTIHITQYTKESTSDSTACKIIPNGESKERRTLGFLYRNEAKQEHQHRSPTHAGACELRVSGLEPRELEGRYWTGRFTAGDMTLSLLDRDTCYGSFTELEEKFGNTV